MIEALYVKIESEEARAKLPPDANIRLGEPIAAQKVPRAQSNY